MLRVTIKGLLARTGRLAATVVAVMLGVAFTAGTLVLTDTIGKTFDDLFTKAYDGTDAVVRAPIAFAAPAGASDQRGRVDQSLVAVVAGVDGVAVAEGTVEGYTQLVGADGNPLGDPEIGAPTLGGNWSRSDDLNPFTLVEGRAPTADDEVVIDRKSANDGRLRVGDTTTVLVQGPPQPVEVVGIAKFGDANSPGGASFVLFTSAAAQRLVAQPGKFDSIFVVADRGVSQQELANRIASVVPESVEVVTGDEISQESKDAVRDDLVFFKVFMLVFAVVALLVGSFMIFNTFSITVAQRSRENALLRALGASKRQVLGSVLVEALVVGVLASLAGLAAGIAVASGLQVLLAGFGFEMPPGGAVLGPRTVVVAILVGVLVTMAAAFAPARKAARVPPIAALRDTNVGSTGHGSQLRILIGLGVLGLGVAALLTGLFAGVDSPMQLVGLGALLVFFGVSVLGRTIAGPLSRLLGSPLPALRGIAGELARENAMRNPKRTAATASALMIGVGLVGFITIVAASTRASVNGAIDDSFTGDLVIESSVGGLGGFDPALAARINELPEVRAATGARTGAAAVKGNTQELLALDPASAFDIIDVQPLEGSPADLGDDAIAVFRDVAADNGLEIGDTVPVIFKDTGPKELTVALIYGENQTAGDYFLGIDAYEANFAHQLDSQVFIAKADDVSPEAALAAVRHVADEYPGAEVLDEAGYKAEQTRVIDRLLGLVYALLALAIVIALLGIGNTLALSILDRTRELGLLRAVGMTRSQVRTTVRWEAVIIAVQGTVLGLVIGLFFGWALVAALHDEGVDRLEIPYVNLAVVVVLAALAGVVAAILPARRAAKLDVLQAIVTE